MFDLTKLPELFSPLNWLNNLGKGDADHVKTEVAELLQHSSQSLRTLIDLDQTFVEIPREDFASKFWPISAHAYWVFTSPEAAQRARTHCTDIQRDVARINFKMAKVLRVEGVDWRGINHAFAELLDADRDYLFEYEKELTRLGKELKEIEQMLGEKDTQQAWDRYQTLRTSIQTSRRQLSDQIALMQKAQTHLRT